MSVPLFLQHWPGASGKLIPLLFGRVIFDLNGHDGHGGHWSGIRVGVDFEMGVKTEITLPLFGPDVRSALLCPQLRARLRLRIHDVLITALLDIFGGGHFPLLWCEVFFDYHGISLIVVDTVKHIGVAHAMAEAGVGTVEFAIDLGAGYSSHV